MIKKLQKSEAYPHSYFILTFQKFYFGSYTSKVEGMIL